MGSICVLIEKDGSARADADLAAGTLGNGAVGRAAGRVAVAVRDPLFGESGRGLYEDDAVLIACDAEFYNARELMPQDGRASEAAIIAALYRKSGEDWWKPVRGVFGAFIWDKAKEKGLLFTDRLGVRPIVYHEGDKRFAAATRLGSLTALPGFDRARDNQALYSYLFMEMIPTPYTIFKHARKLEGGHFLRLSGGRAEIARAWNMSYPAEKLSDRKRMEAGIRERMQAAVERQAAYRAGPGEAGAFLSGGTDSSLIAGLMSQSAQGSAKTFSIGFDESGYDEMGYARIAAKRFKTDAHEYYVTQADIVSALPGIVAAFDEPFANSSVIPTYFCALKAKEAGVKYMLGGDGGDEIFGGNARYNDYFAAFRRFPRAVEIPMSIAVALAPAWAKVGPVKKAANYLARKKAPLHELIHAYDLSYYLDSVDDIFDPAFLAEGRPFLKPPEIARRILEQADTQDVLDRYLYHDLKNTLMDNDLRKVNTMTELAGVQVRYPFLDDQLVEFTGLIPSDLKVHQGQLRYLYKETFKDFLPTEIINKTKHGFGLPVVPWMLREGTLHDLLRDALFDGRLARRGIFRAGFVEDLYRRSRSDKTPYYGAYLYYIFFLELWMREHFDKPAATARARA
jgi:asparagine synthase (glutamine-hydrolysing)